MPGFSGRLLAVFAATLAIAAVPASAQKTPERIRLTAESRQGAVLIRVPVQPFDYALSFSRDGNSGFMSRVYVMGVRAGPPGYRYIARTLTPGRYRLDSVWQQGVWSACLEQGTLEVPVVAGEIAFVGTFQAQPILEWIQQRAIERGRTEVGAGDPVVQRPDNLQPIVDGRDEAGLGEARQFAQEVMNGSGALLRLADVQQTSFVTSGASRAIEVCG